MDREWLQAEVKSRSRRTALHVGWSDQRQHALDACLSAQPWQALNILIRGGRASITTLDANDSHGVSVKHRRTINVSLLKHLICIKSHPSTTLKGSRYYVCIPYCQILTSSWLIMEGQAATRYLYLYLSSEYKLITWGKTICSQQDRLGGAEAGIREKKRVHQAERWKGAHRVPGPESRCAGVLGTTPAFLVTVSGREIRDRAEPQTEGGERSHRKAWAWSHLQVRAKIATQQKTSGHNHP